MSLLRSIAPAFVPLRGVHRACPSQQVIVSAAFSHPVGCHSGFVWHLVAAGEAVARRLRLKLMCWEVPVASRTKLSFVLVAASGLSVAANAQPSFTGLGDLPGGFVSSQAHGVSADGRVVAGSANGTIGSTVAFTWTRDAGMVALPPLGGPAGIYRGQGISGDGRTVVGLAESDDGYRAAMWQDGAGPTHLPDATDLSTTWSVSQDGGVIAGRQGSNMAAIWTSDGIRELGRLPGHTSSFARAVSADGQVVVGESSGPGSGGVFKWTETSGMQEIGSPSDIYRLSSALALSADGSIVGGRGFGPAGSGPAIWTEADGVTMLGPAPAGTSGGYVFEMSADASVLGINAFRSGDWIAVLWTPERGQELLINVLTQRCGLDLTGWHLSEIGGISADGTVIVGTGTHNGFAAAFVAVIPVPSVIAPFAVFACNRRRR